MKSWSRALAVWVLLMAAEVIHGVLRTLLLLPRVGAFRSSQIGVLTGSLILFAIVVLTIRWLNPPTTRFLAAVGMVWVGLTLAFEILLGRVLLGYPWERIAADYDLARGGLMPLGLLILALAPYLAARIRGAPDGPASQPQGMQ